MTDSFSWPDYDWLQYCAFCAKEWATHLATFDIAVGPDRVMTHYDRHPVCEVCVTSVWLRVLSDGGTWRDWVIEYVILEQP